MTQELKAIHKKYFSKMEYSIFLEYWNSTEITMRVKELEN